MIRVCVCLCSLFTHTIISSPATHSIRLVTVETGADQPIIVAVVPADLQLFTSAADYCCYLSAVRPSLLLVVTIDSSRATHSIRLVAVETGADQQMIVVVAPADLQPFTSADQHLITFAGDHHCVSRVFTEKF
ncbi:hypothetical protein L1987_81565 [Smallanthus sonchifolius]|uniref:Uncharacterized protein n=1 Tax=Smallanthus sonchifolius TaxID=185202 RepID=A0ACB8YQ54_9ASTR|nr:hypothetical protein L1987_81565 [Smallanthus sonchifolius]